MFYAGCNNKATGGWKCKPLGVVLEPIGDVDGYLVRGDWLRRFESIFREIFVISVENWQLEKLRDVDCKRIACRRQRTRCAALEGRNGIIFE